MAHSSLNLVLTQLAHSAAQLIDQCRQIVAQELVAEALLAALPRLHSFLEEQGLFLVRLQHRLETLRQIMAARQQRALASQDYAHASVVCELPGKAAGEIVAGMIQAAQLRDRHSLVLLFLDRWQAVLQDEIPSDTASAVEQPTLSHLLLQVSPERCIDLFETLFAGSLGTGHSLYEIVAEYGITRLVTDLLNRAEPLCQLNQRDIEAFNVTPSQHTVIRLPEPTGPRDKELRERIAAAFRHALRGLPPCTILDAAPGETEAISVVKAKVGWPLLIEAGNTDLLLHYARCEQLGHWPHLIGIVPHSPHGAVIPAYVTLARQLLAPAS